MQENEIIRQLKAYKYVKPDKKWLCSVKSEILKQKQGSDYPHNSWAFFHRQSFFVGAMAASVLVLFVFFFGIHNSAPSTDAEFMALSSSLQSLQANLNSVSGNLHNAINNLKDNPMAVLEVKKQVENTLEQGEAFIAQAKKKAQDIQVEQEKQKVMSVLTGTEQTLKDIEQANKEVEKQAVQREIADLQTISLDKRQKELLELAKKQFEKNNYQQALITIIELTQN